MGNSSSTITNTVTNNDSELAERPLKRLKVSSSFVEGSVSENQTTSIALPPGKHFAVEGDYIRKLGRKEIAVNI